MGSLWGDDFVVEKIPAKKVIKKVSSPKDPTQIIKQTRKASGLSLNDRLELIRKEVIRVLGRYADNTQVIHTREDLHKSIDLAISNGIIAIDTETNNSLEPITCKLMGPCIYTPGGKNVYIPINHVNPVTRELLPNQCTEQDIKEEFSRLSDTKILMHNGKFDYQVIKCTCGIELSVYWDTMLGVRILDENEKRAGLKEQYIDKIDSSVEKYSIDHLFKDIEYAVVDPDLFALYAATDAYMTYKLYEWQLAQFNKPGNERIKALLLNIEMPVMTIAAEMELAGMEIDADYSKRLSEKYHNKLQDVVDKTNVELEKLRPIIEEWRKTPEANFHPQSKKPNKFGEYTLQKSKSEQLADPPQLTSPTQFAILLYDVLKTPVVDKKSPRGTGEEIIKQIPQPVCKLLLEQRGLEKLIGTYIDKLPTCVCSKDSRLHAHFNQLGTDTGRFSSSDPNLQNIPSKSKNIRLMFKAAEGYRLCGGDFSAQEPRLTAHYANDPQMIKAYEEGKDLYAVIASASFNQPYEECLEFYPEGTVIEFEGKKVTCGNKTHQNKEGKHRRSMAKSILLGILYGRGATSVGEQIGKSTKEAQDIINKFFDAFPNVKKWIDKTMFDAHKLGYVEDIVGRRRRLPDIQLPKFTITDRSEGKVSSEVNPLLGSLGKVHRIENPNIVKYRKELENAHGWQQVNKIKESAKAQNIDIRDNGAFISQAERQAVNSRVQGGAATLTKLALIEIYNDKRFSDIGARLVNTVHDEILVEVPIENSKLAEQYLSEDMINSAKRVVKDVPMKTDTYNVRAWYEDEQAVAIQEYYKKLVENGMPHSSAIEEVKKEFSEFTETQIKEFLEYN